MQLINKWMYLITLNPLDSITLLGFSLLVGLHLHALILIRVATKLNTESGNIRDLAMSQLIQFLFNAYAASIAGKPPQRLELLVSRSPLTLRNTGSCATTMNRANSESWGDSTTTPLATSSQRLASARISSRGRILLLTTARLVLG